MTLEARNLTSGYGRVMILHGVSIAIPTGGVVAILGPNGAGKSTLLRTLAGLLPVMEGELRFEDERYDGSDPRSIADSGIVLVPQRRSVFTELSVAENLALPALGYPSSEDNPAEEMLMRFPVLAERAIQPAGSLSGGERQILAVAAALVMKPKVLLLDEPTSGLSPLATAEIAEVIGACTEKGVAVAWVVEQMPEVALREADHAYFLEGGEITFSDEASLLLDRERLRALMLDHT